MSASSDDDRATAAEPVVSALRDGIPSAELEAAMKLTNALVNAIERLPDDDIARAMNAFYKASETNCWFMVFALRHVLPPILAMEADSRGIETASYFAQAIEAQRAETGTGSVHESAVLNEDAPDV